MLSKNYISTRGETRLPSNTRPDADAAFMSEVQATDPERYQRLQDESILVPEALRPLLAFVGKPSPTLIRDILTAPENRTVPIVEKLLSIAQPRFAGDLEKRARKVLSRIAKSKTGALPVDGAQLAAWSELNELETAMSAEDIQIGEQVRVQGKRHTPRKFKKCKQCGQRFLAKRANQEFHTEKCKLRWSRQNRRNRGTESDGVIREIANTPLEPAISLAI